MLLIPCPWCGPRGHEEFTFGDAADKRRPAQPQRCDDDTWAEFLYGPQNPPAGGRYLVCHSLACGLWFAVDFDTSSHELTDSRPLGGRDGGRTA